MLPRNVLQDTAFVKEIVIPMELHVRLLIV